MESLINDPATPEIDNMKTFLNFYMSEHKLTSITTIQLRETWEYFVEYMMTGLTPA